jgi:hypothetical protein
LAILRAASKVRLISFEPPKPQALCVITQLLAMHCNLAISSHFEVLVNGKFVSDGERVAMARFRSGLRRAREGRREESTHHTTQDVKNLTSKPQNLETSSINARHAVAIAFDYGRYLSLAVA